MLSDEIVTKEITAIRYISYASIMIFLSIFHVTHTQLLFSVDTGDNK